MTLGLFEKVQESIKQLEDAKADKSQILKQLKEAFDSAVVYEEEKVALANQTYELIDKHIRRLDEDLIKFDTEISSINVPSRSQGTAASKPKRTGIDPEPASSIPDSKNEGRKRERRSARLLNSLSETANNGNYATGASQSNMDYGESDNGDSIPGLDIMPLDPNEPTYCYCGQVSFGEMIGCDNEGCEIEWFHYDCVGLKNPPKGKWYCHECLTKRKKGLLKQ